MPIRCQCPECSLRYEIDDELVGKTLLCPECQTRFQPKGTPRVRRRRDDEDFDEEDRVDFQRAMPAIIVFAGLNFGLAVLCALWLLAMIALLVYGIGFSRDEEENLAEGVLGTAVLAASGFVGFVIYLTAGLGLARRRAWGYFCHCAGAVLAALSCVGLVYTVFAFVFAFRPEFTAAFFSSVDQPRARKRRKAESWDET
jgi:hypothetical protein